MPDNIKAQRQAQTPRPTNSTANVTVAGSSLNAAPTNSTYSTYTYTTIASFISPTILAQAVANNHYKQRFCYDTAANRHVFNDRSRFIEYTPTKVGNVHGSTGSTIAEGIGTVCFNVVKSDGTTHELYLINVLYCPSFATNVISQAPFKRKGAWYHSGQDRIYTASNEELAYLPEIDGIPNFLVVADPSEAPAALSYASLHAFRSSADEPSATRSAADWHHIYAHLNMEILRRTAKAVKGMNISTSTLINCEPCGLSKSKKIISRKPQDRPDRLLGMVHVDIVGPITPAGKHGELYWLLLTDGKSRRRWIFTADSRAVLGVKLIEWCKQQKTHFNLTVGTFRFDNAREFINYRTD
jgi:hypothetical protein